MSWAARVIRSLVWVYQATISPLFPAHCRYWPTCSVYARQAVREHGAVFGGWLALRRVLRCNPFGGWGYDPVPPRCRHDHDTDRTSVRVRPVS